MHAATFWGGLETGKCLPLRKRISRKFPFFISAKINPAKIDFFCIRENKSQRKLHGSKNRENKSPRKLEIVKTAKSAKFNPREN